MLRIYINGKRIQDIKSIRIYTKKRVSSARRHQPEDLCECDHDYATHTRLKRDDGFKECDTFGCPCCNFRKQLHVPKIVFDDGDDPRISWPTDYCTCSHQRHEHYSGTEEYGTGTQCRAVESDCNCEGFDLAVYARDRFDKCERGGCEHERQNHFSDGTGKCSLYKCKCAAFLDMQPKGRRRKKVEAAEAAYSTKKLPPVKPGVFCKCGCTFSEHQPHGNNPCRNCPRCIKFRFATGAIRHRGLARCLRPDCRHIRDVHIATEDHDSECNVTRCGCRGFK